MPRRLPPLTALRAFEAAARLKSASKAADELAVTQSAVSHQLRTLEDWLGQKLFRRAGRGLALTEAGARLLPEIEAGFDRIEAAIRRAQLTDPRAGWLTVAMMPSFATKWLVPRLPGFRAAHPEIDVWIATFDFALDDLRGEVDLTIRYGAPDDFEGFHAVRVLEEEVFPVCAPALAGRLRTPADLGGVTLLHDELGETWSHWFTAAGIEPGFDPEKGPGFDDSALLIQAAAAGMGVALGRSVLVAEDITAGRLVVPFGPRLRTQNAYYAVTLPETADLPKIAAFRDWLTAAARAG